jgi:hypothetical protein
MSFMPMMHISRSRPCEIGLQHVALLSAKVAGLRPSVSQMDLGMFTRLMPSAMTHPIVISF